MQNINKCIYDIRAATSHKRKKKKEKKVEGNIKSKTHLPRLQYHTKVHLIESQNHGNKPLTKPVMSVANNAKTFMGILEKIRYEMKSSFQSLGWLLFGEK